MQLDDCKITGWEFVKIKRTRLQKIQLQYN